MLEVQADEAHSANSVYLGLGSLEVQTEDCLLRFVVEAKLHVLVVGLDRHILDIQHG